MKEELVIQFIFFMGVIIPTLYLNEDILKTREKINILLMGVVTLIVITVVGYRELFFLIFEMEIIIFLVFKDILSSKILLTLNTAIVILIAFRVVEGFILKSEERFIINIEIAVITVIFTIMLWNLKKLVFKEKIIGIVILLFIVGSLILKNYMLGGIAIFGAVSIYFIILNLELKKEIKRQEIRIESLSEYAKNLEELNKETRKFKHDYTNTLASMSEFFNREDFTSLKEFFNSSIMPLGEKELIKELRLGVLGKIKVCEFKSILINKVMKAYENNVKVHIDVDDEIEDINIDKVMLSRIIGIILDNAIEAASESEEREILIGVFKKHRGINIVVENFFIDRGLYLHEMMREGVSSKGENRGLGLSNINEMLNKSSNVVLDTSIEKNKFIQHMIIY